MEEFGQLATQDATNACGERILVSVRLRPINEKEIARNDVSDWECINDKTIIFKNSLHAPTAYTFDRVFCCDRSTKQVYEEAAKEVALSVMSGINSSIFAYGQTSSGKTYTMTGITEYTLADIFDYIQKHEERAFALKFSAMEIYNEAVRDLLSYDPTPLRLLDDPERGTMVERLTEETLMDWSHLQELLSICEDQRQIGETCLNETSSRSHQILRLTVESSAREFMGRESSSTLIASVNFVDLAGSERASQTLSAGQRLKEGCHINRSLLTLGTIIRKLSKGRNGHMPYRDSKLTRILQSSLGGNARTAIICTMSPARTHVEQSRNTLSFATCAKAVVTNARVNVVMSDKALVKHLQRELDRLETELRGSGTASSTSHCEVTLREREILIQKMEQEIKELIQQRDLAQSRLEDLLRVAEVSHPPADTQNLCEEELPLSESIDLADQSLDFGFSNFNPDQYSIEHCRTDSDESYMEISEIPKNQISSGNMSPQHSITSHRSVTSIMHQNEEENSHVSGVEEFCKEVRCIDMKESSMRSNGAPIAFSSRGNESLLPLAKSDNVHPSSQKLESSANKDRKWKLDLTKVLVDYKFEEVQKSVDNIVKSYFNKSSMWPISADLLSSASSSLNRSRSCRAALMTQSSSPWLQEAEPNGNTPSSVYWKDFLERPGGFNKRPCALKYGDENGSPSRESSPSRNITPSRESLHTPEQSESSDTLKPHLETVHSFVAGLEEMAKVQSEEKIADGPEAEMEVNEEPGTERKDVALDPMESQESPTHWPIEFERQQRELIELWHTCNISLVHRTYFFLLFEGDPADSIYMEVELRRLSFLKKMFSQEKFGKRAVEDGLSLTAVSSARALRRERELLSKQMLKRFSEDERENLYRRWDIELDSKQRRLQLVRRLWTKTGDMDHIKASASIVAKLIGFLEQGHAPKEMFSLSFMPRRANQSSFSWRSSKSFQL